MRAPPGAVKHIRREIDMRFQGYKKFQAESQFLPVRRPTAIY